MFLKHDERFLDRLRSHESRSALLKDCRFQRNLFLALLALTVAIQSVLMFLSAGQPVAWFVGATFMVIFLRADSDCRLVLAVSSIAEQEPDPQP